MRGIFLNIGLDTGKRQMIRAVVEGIAYNKRLLLEGQARRVRPSFELRFAGGGAVSDATAQILADVTGHPVAAVVDPQYAGAAGAALVAAWGAGRFPSLEAAARTVDVRARFTPDPCSPRRPRSELRGLRRPPPRDEGPVPPPQRPAGLGTGSRTQAVSRNWTVRPTYQGSSAPRSWKPTWPPVRVMARRTGVVASSPAQSIAW